MKVCKITCDACDKEVERVTEIGMGEAGYGGMANKFKTWHTFDLCADCFRQGRPAFKLIWPKFLRSMGESK